MTSYSFIKQIAMHLRGRLAQNIKNTDDDVKFSKQNLSYPRDRLAWKVKDSYGDMEIVNYNNDANILDAETMEYNIEDDSKMTQVPIIKKRRLKNQLRKGYKKISTRKAKEKKKRKKRKKATT